jgi:UDP-N-acetylglucosamine--N-acetylmuramyl-(pentapeptide) pyrophosphoryl-undecaprenol N-acetylglucosamine transferase
VSGSQASIAFGPAPGSQAGPTFLFAGGGSGGHISPALAMAERLGELEQSVRSLFVCSNRAVDTMMLSAAGIRFQATPATPFSARPAPLVRFAVNFRRSVRSAQAFISRERVDRVVALGGFVAAPVVAAAAKNGVPVTLVNLDAPPGKANRWIARRCQQVLSAIETPQQPGFAHRVVGMPVRRNALAPAPPEACRKRLGLDPQTRTLLVTGASQGARSINALLVALATADPGMFAGWQLCHLCGPTDVDTVRRAYARAAVPAKVEPFASEMGLAWGAADLALSRAGASSVAEARANAVPTIFMPYPHHRDRHQQRNARPMVEAGGAVIEADQIHPARNAGRAGQTLRRLLRNHDRRAAMQAGLRARPAPDAAGVIARLLLEQNATKRQTRSRSQDRQAASSPDP